MKVKNIKNKTHMSYRLPLLFLAMACFVSLSMIHISAVAGDKGDFPADEVPPVTKVVGSDYFTIPSISNSFFHPNYPNVVTITQNAGNLKGAVWSKEKVPLTSAFSYETYFYVGRSADRPMGAVSGIAGADGVTFTMQNDPAGINALGSWGHGLGAYAVSGRSNGIKNAVSFEFDTYPDLYDVGTGDIIKNNDNMHTAFVKPTDPNGYYKHYDVKLIGAYSDEKGSILSRWVQFDAKWVPNDDGSGDLSITLNGVVSIYHIDNYLQYFNGDSVYFGYTAATGTGYEMQAVALAKMPTSYYMHFDLNAPDLAGQTIESQILLKGEYATPVADPVRTGYTFQGWNTAADGSGTTWDFVNMPMNEGDFTLYAQWQPINYQLSFDTQGADSSAIDPQTVPFDTYATPVTAPTKEGFAFNGWNTAADGSGTSWDFATNKMPASDTLLYAQWQANNYQLSFDTQGADSPAITAQSVIFDTLATPVATPTKIGHIFVQWNTAADGSGTTWDFATNKMPAKDMTLYAQWIPNIYDVIFDLNGANSGLIAPQKVAYQKPIGIVLSPSKIGHTFTGWNTLADGSGTMWDFVNDKMPANDVTLYAQWQVNKYQLSFDTQGADSAAIDAQPVEYDAIATPVIAPTKVGYTFKGWNTSADGSGTMWDFATDKMPANDVTLYAQWTTNEYLLNFDTRGADSRAIIGQSVAYDTYATPVTEPVKLGHTFLGWNTVADGSGAMWDFATDKMPANNVTLYAQWAINEYALDFDTQGADSDAIVGQSVAFDTYATPVTVPTKLGYTFTGWNTSADGSGTMWDFATNKMPARDVMLYAQWDVNSYKITFDSNLGNGTMEDEVYKYLENKKLDANKFQRPGYTFVGWSLSKDGSVEYKNEEMYSYLDAKDTVLYAVWSKDEVIAPSKKSTPSILNTSDHTNVLLWSIVLFASSILAILIVVKRKYSK